MTTTSTQCERSTDSPSHCRTTDFISGLISSIVAKNYVQIAQWLREAPDDSEILIRSHAYMTVGLRNAIVKQDWKLFLIFWNRQQDTNAISAFEMATLIADGMARLKEQRSTEGYGCEDDESHKKMDAVLCLASTALCLAHAYPRGCQIFCNESQLARSAAIEFIKRRCLLLCPDEKLLVLDRSCHWSVAYEAKCTDCNFWVDQVVGEVGGLPAALCDEIASYILPYYLLDTIQLYLKSAFEHEVPLSSSS